ncbi:MAG: ABC transporter substrate-binding protein [Alphaproteobacteria bacterium]
MRTKHFRYGFTILLLTTLAAPVSAADSTGTPSAFVTSLARTALTSASDKSLSTADLRRRLDDLLDTGFDMPQIAAYVTGPYWQAASAEEKHAFTAVFRDYVGHAYTRRFTEYDIGTFRVTGQREENYGNTVVTSEVDQIASTDGAKQTPANVPVRLDWLVAGRNGYRIIDITVQGASMAATKRAEFTSYLQHNSGGLTSLTQRLRSMKVARQ